jgi:para-aminobenzoate synthetase component 1
LHDTKNAQMVASRHTYILPLPEHQVLQVSRQLSVWASELDPCVVLSSNARGSTAGHHTWEILVAGGAEEYVPVTGDAFEQVKQFRTQQQDWLFGYWGYDLKNVVEPVLESNNPNRMMFPEALFFVPRHVAGINAAGELVVHTRSADAVQVAHQILATSLPHTHSCNIAPAHLQAAVTREQYIRNVEQIIRHIVEGDVYELNYCMEFFAEAVSLRPFDTFSNLMQVSPVPFAAYLKSGPHVLMCASPERFLRKEGRKLFSQPIKGTIRRGSDEAEDERLKHALRQSEKERAENMMIVDLVRNDLSRSCLPGTVQVDEFFGIYTFPQVHQMISTVSGNLYPDVDTIDSIRYAFPMGSMTGAPKVMAMELIERYENSQRGLYSGAVGYLTPDDDFDFNVVIRSILYNEQLRLLSFQVGSAITYDSDPEAEYNECQLKAKAIREVLGVNHP